MPSSLTDTLAVYPVIVLDGCDGVGKTTLAAALRDQHGYAVIHSGRTPDGIDLVTRYRQLLATTGRIVLDRSFVSELVYGPLFHGASRITRETAAGLSRDAARRGGTLVHLTGNPELIVARLRSRDGIAPPIGQIRSIIDAYYAAFGPLVEAVPVITADTTSTAIAHGDRRLT